MDATWDRPGFSLPYSRDTISTHPEMAQDGAKGGMLDQPKPMVAWFIVQGGLSSDDAHTEAC
jgi:hypothetical protein